MKNKYLIQYSTSKYCNIRECDYYIKENPVVKNFTDEELETFCKDKQKVKVTFLCKCED